MAGLAPIGGLCGRSAVWGGEAPFFLLRFARLGFIGPIGRI